MPHIRYSHLLRYGIVVLIVTLALVLMLMLDPWLSMRKTPFLLFFSAVMVSAWYGGLKSGLLATSLSALLSGYFFLPLSDDLSFDLSNFLRIGLFALQGLLFSILCEVLKTAKSWADENLQKLRVCEERFRLALSSSDIVVFQQDRDLRYQWIHNPQSLNTAEEILGKSDYELFPALVAEQLRAIKQKVLETGISTREEVYLTIGGENRYYDLLVEPLRDVDNSIQGIICVGVNITQLKQTEQALQESEAKFRSVVESNMIGIGFWHRDGRITDANDALLNMVGYTREELLAGTLHWQDLTPTEYLPLDKQALTQFQDNSFCTPFEKEYIRKDGSRFPILAGGSHFEGTVDRGAFFVLDITERKQAEERLRHIAQTSSLLSTSLDYEETLEQIAKISVPQLADWCSVDILNEDGSIRRLPIAHADPSKAELARKLQEYATDYKGASVITKVLQTGQSELISEIPDSLLVAGTQNEEHLELVRQLGIKSVMIVPLIAQGQVLGTISFVSTQSDRRYDRTDLTLATDISHRAALAMENARLYRDIHQALVHYAESLSLLDALLVAAPVAVCFLDRELRYIRINQVFADINGLTIEEHLERKFGEVLPAMAADWELQLQRVLDTGEPLLNVEISGKTREQPERYGYWLGNYYPVNNPMGETVGIGIILADVTAAKQTEVALRESEERFRAMFNQAAVGISLIALDGRFIQVNPALCEITGYSHEELIQLNFQEITHPDDLEIDWENARRVLTKEISGYSLEKRYIRKDGSIVWVNLTSSAVWDDKGQPKYALGIIEDISERQAALYDHKRVEATQQFLVEASTLLAASLDYEIALESVANLAVPTLADWCIVDVFQKDWSSKQIAIAIADPTKQSILDEIRRRYPPKTRTKQLVEQLGLGISIFYPELSDYNFVQMAQNEEHLQLLRSLGISSLMVIPVRSRGQLFGAISFFTAESGRHYQQTDLALAEDIARRAAIAIDNARLYQETERSVNRTILLQRITAAFSEALTPQQVADVVVNQGIAALEATGGSVVLLTEGGTTLKVVQAIGYPQTLIDTWVTFPITASNQIAETVRTGQPVFLENLAAMIARYPDLADIVTVIGNNAWASIPLVAEGKVIGALGLSFTPLQIFNEEDRGFMLTLGQQCAQAIARAQLYEAEKTARAQAETANRIKDEFLAVLSHELRTPLNPILGWAKLLRTRNFDEATRIRALETIERNAKLQTQLIGDLLDVSRILQGKVRLNLYAVDLKVAIAGALETVRLAAEAKSIEIKTVLSPDIGKVLGDGDRLQQVMWNLLSNAVKFTSTEGRVEVRLEQVGSEAQIQVIDTGKGIMLEFLPYVFDYFRQADAKTTRIFGGLGLGLAIVRHLVELHGGTVQAESLGEGQGATFTVRLPLLKNSELRVSSDEASQPELSTDDTLLAGVKILLVDDQADVREFFSFALEQYGATVTLAESATEALEILTQSKPDILLSDIGMPLMDGYMLLREVRKLPPEQGGQIPAIALTAYAGEINYNQAMAAGFQKHLPKPVDPGDLASAIVNLIGQNQF
ncbi:MAG: PAS domain S-box protein [Nostoc sp.]|uniref:PAS domain S-box protein n=1 Tax=Nostoc sp. TaxID=1180 RepID=UPI002FF5F0E0